MFSSVNNRKAVRRLHDVPRPDVEHDRARRHADHAVVTVAPGDTLLVAYGRMRMYDVSQLPVLEGSRLVGIIDQSDLLHAAVDDAARLRKQVRDVMTTRLRTVTPSARVEDVVHLIDDGYTPIVVDGDAFLGLVTPIDVVNHVRRQLHS